MKAALLLAVALGACVPSFAADAPRPQNRYAASIAPAERFEVGSLLVERHGEVFALRQQQYMRAIGVIDVTRADDAGTMIDAMAELLALDLRPGLPNIKVPVLLIAPYFELDSSQRGMTREMKSAYYASLMAGTPKLQVVSIAPARHFVMFDQPQVLADALRAYLKSL